MATTNVYAASIGTEAFSGIEQDRWKPGRNYARVEGGPCVWLIVATLRRLEGDEQKTAEEWGISPDQVRRANHYYEKHSNLIDAHFLLVNEKETA